MFEFIGKKDSQNGQCWVNNAYLTDPTCKSWMDTLLNETVNAMKYTNCYDKKDEDGILDYNYIGVVSNDADITTQITQEIANLVAYQAAVRANMGTNVPRGAK